MSDVPKFDVSLEWRADRSGRENTAAGIEGGMGPEALFVAAAASSLGATLADMLHASGLPHSSLAIRAEGLVCAANFTTITVHPTIHVPTLCCAESMSRPLPPRATIVLSAGRSAATSPLSSVWLSHRDVK
jgi:hypothetical protein